MMAESQFDVENALPRLTDEILPMLPLLEYEEPAQAPAPTVPQTGVGERLEEGPGRHQLPPLNNVADLALALEAFREAERRIFGHSTQENVYNRRQAEGYMNSESDEEYLQDDEDDEDQLNEEDSSMELDPDLPPPANDAGSRGSTPNLQMQEDEHGVHGEHHSKRPCITTLGFILNVPEVVAEVQYIDSGLPDQAAEPVNTEFVPPERSLTFCDEALSTELQAPNSDPIFAVIVEEPGHDVHEIIKHVNPSSSEILTLAASMTPKTLLPGTSDKFVLCESTLEPATSSASNGRIAEGVSVQKPAANASVSEGESSLKPTCLKAPSAV